MAKRQANSRYGVVFYETLAEATDDLDNLKLKSRSVDRLNIVVRAEADMDDVELNRVGKLFAGKAWHTIHERRVYEGWYIDRH